MVARQIKAFTSNQIQSLQTDQLSGINKKQIVNLTPDQIEALKLGKIDLGFGRLRISDPYTLFDSALNGERRYDFSTATTGSGNVTFDYNANVRKLNVTSSISSANITTTTNIATFGTAVYFATNGNVGIGSTNPGMVLDVQGSIRSSSFSGQSNGVLLCVQGTRIGYCSGSVSGVSCTCN